MLAEQDNVPVVGWCCRSASLTLEEERFVRVGQRVSTVAKGLGGMQGRGNLQLGQDEAAKGDGAESAWRSRQYGES